MAIHLKQSFIFSVVVMLATWRPGWTDTVELVDTGQPNATFKLVAEGSRIVYQGFTQSPFQGELRYYDARTDDARFIAAVVVDRLETQVHIGERYVVFLAHELDSRQDYNGDGDQQDVVPHFYDLETDDVINIGVAVDFVFQQQVPTRVSFVEPYLIFWVREAAENHGGTQGTSLNGDGDFADRVLHVYDLSTKTLTNVGWGILSTITVAGRYVAVVPHELNLTVSEDLNADGDFSDFVPQVFDFSASDPLLTRVNVGLAGTFVRLAPDGAVSLAVSERQQGDRNGDGDDVDNILHTLEPGAAAVNHMLPVVDHVWSGPFLGFQVAEQDFDDLNQDGDMIDRIAHVFSRTSGDVTNLGFSLFSGMEPAADDRLLFLARESLEGRDLNGDQDLGDDVWFVRDAAGSVNDLPLTNTQIRVLDDSVLGSLRESLEDEDFNEDGDTLDTIFHLYHLSDGTTTNLRSSGSPLITAGERFVAVVSEFFEEVDLNGDGDTTDNIHHLYDPACGLVNLGLNARSIDLTDEMVAALISEVQNDIDIDGDGLKTSTLLMVDLFAPQPLEQVSALEDAILDLEIHHGIETSLLGKLAEVAAFIAEGSFDEAIEKLVAFIHQVEAQSGKKIPTEDADAWIAAANELIATLSEAG